MKKIFLDAGHNHSRFNTGAAGNGLREQDISFDVAKRVSDLLKTDFETMLSRPNNETNLGTDNASSINTRWQLANQWGADYFISVHCNAGGGTGAETLYFKNDSEQFAKTINNVYSLKMGLRNRGAKKRGDIAVLSRSNMPSCLMELGFLDAPEGTPDVAILTNRRQDMAEAIADGIYDFMGKNRVKVPQIPVVVDVKGAKTDMEDKMTPELKNQIQEMIKLEIEAALGKRYNNLEEVPEWGKDAIRHIITLDAFSYAEELDLSHDMLRQFVLNYRLGIYNSKTVNGG